MHNMRQYEDNDDEDEDDITPPEKTNKGTLNKQHSDYEFQRPEIDLS